MKNLKTINVKYLALLGVVCLFCIGTLTSFIGLCGALEKGPIKIGAILDFTGVGADLDPNALEGIKVALDEVNYQVAGRKIKLIVEDGASDPVKSLEKLKKLVERDGIRINLATLMEHVMLAMAPYAAEKKILMSCYFNGPGELTEYGNWILHPTTGYANTIPLGWYAYDVLGYRTMITVGSDYSGGYDFVGGAAEAFKQRGGKIVQQLWTPLGLADYGPYLSTIKKADTVMHFLASVMESARFEKAYIDSGLKMPLLHITQDGHYSEKAMKEFGDGLLGIIGESSYIWTRDDPINKKFVTAYKAKTGELPGADSVNGYSLTKLILAGLEATGGDDSFDKLWPAVKKIKLKTPQGSLSFTDKGVGIIDVYITKAVKKNGQYMLEPLKAYRGLTDPRIK
tara:strand:- start:185 stop:1378 length:1194 start_codon:yes stop_codon:yes gene_type:complete